jgi:predicted AAA+ superfamily ATPase
MGMKRALQEVIEKQLFKGKTILLFGPRRAGKTHLVREIINLHGGKYFNAENLEVRAQLATTSLSLVREFVGKERLIVIDEVQALPDAGLKLKVLHDTFPGVQFIATGSSAFEMYNSIGDSLLGRSRYYKLYPVSYDELRKETSGFDAYVQLEPILRFGSYPEVLLSAEADRKTELATIAATYLYKDFEANNQLRRADIADEILKLLAYQIGQQVSLNEIANATNTTVKTVSRYIQLLEEAFIIFHLRSYSRNLRNEIGKSRKYYFIDLGIRNAIINNFNPIPVRNDVGQLWENYCVIERIKRNGNTQQLFNTWFWRTYDQKEIDYIEEADGKLSAYEFKWSDKPGKPPKAFLEGYPGSDYKVITKENFFEFV